RSHFDPVFNAIPGENLTFWGWWAFRAPGDCTLGAAVPINYRLPANFATLPGATQQSMYDDRINAFGSQHPGGANVCMADGSGRFLSETTSLLTLQKLSTRSMGEVILSLD